MAIIYHEHRDTLVAEFSQENSHQWRLVLKDGVSTIAVLEDNSLVTRYLMILNFRCRETHKKYSLCLFPDSFPSKDLQRLRSNIIKR
ncbi:protein YgfX [Candidiatus Paracoxiella cheracis]|uniref:protein YgfX n=1 Tax=Candidiatus Paracoxiella cheracis TaxID=3405120 RepID=UPI003BF475CE